MDLETETGRPSGRNTTLPPWAIVEPLLHDLRVAALMRHVEQQNLVCVRVKVHVGKDTCHILNCTSHVEPPPAPRVMSSVSDLKPFELQLLVWRYVEGLSVGQVVARLRAVLAESEKRRYGDFALSFDILSTYFGILTSFERLRIKPELAL